jgi:hypothetical protein
MNAVSVFASEQRCGHRIGPPSYLFQSSVSVVKLQQGIFSTPHSIERCVRQVEVHRVSFVKINEQPGIRCASPRFGNQHGTKICVNDSLHWSDEARDFTQIITGPTSDI